jgi:hypothetical protein
MVKTLAFIPCEIGQPLEGFTVVVGGKSLIEMGWRESERRGIKDRTS